MAEFTDTHSETIIAKPAFLESNIEVGSAILAGAVILAGTVAVVRHHIGLRNYKNTHTGPGYAPDGYHMEHRSRDTFHRADLYEED